MIESLKKMFVQDPEARSSANDALFEDIFIDKDTQTTKTTESDGENIQDELKQFQEKYTNLY